MGRKCDCFSAFTTSTDDETIFIRRELYCFSHSSLISHWECRAGRLGISAPSTQPGAYIDSPTSPFFIASKNRFPTSPFHALCILPFQFLLRIKRLSNQRPGDTMLIRIGNSWERNCSDKGSPVVFRCAASPRDTKQLFSSLADFQFHKT